MKRMADQFAFTNRFYMVAVENPASTTWLARVWVVHRRRHSVADLAVMNSIP
jgi:hypothetical protein